MKNKVFTFLASFCFVFVAVFIPNYSFNSNYFTYNKVVERNTIKKAYDFNYFNYESNDNIVLVAKNNLHERIVKTDIIVGFNELNYDDYNVRIMFSNVSISNPLTNTSIGLVVEPTFNSIKTINWLEFGSINKDLLVNGFSVYFEFFNLNNIIAVECTFSYYNDLLEAVDFETVHYNNFLDLSSFFTPTSISTYQTFNELKLEGVNFLGNFYFDLGWEARKDSITDRTDTINYIWTILEKAITSVLNVLSFDILPGIPLYVCVGVPILLAVLLWFIKMGQS